MMKPFHKIGVVWIALTLVFLCSCRGEHQVVPKDQLTGTAVSKSHDVAVENSCKDSYAEAYCGVLTYLLDQHGYARSFPTSPNGTAWMSAGLEYAELADMERDGVPELICGADGNIQVFRYDNGVVREILTASYGDRMEYISDEVSEFFYLDTSGEKPYLTVIDCKCTGTDYKDYIERMCIFTLTDGDLHCLTAIGLANNQHGESPGEDCYIYTACQIDGKEVSVDEYVHLIDSYTQEPRIMWAASADIDYHLNEIFESLQKLLNELTEQAGVDKINLADYAEAKQQQKAAPYESNPYILNDITTEAAELKPPTPTDDVLEAYRLAEQTLFSELVTRYWHPRVDSYEFGDFGYEKIDFENDGLPEIIIKDNGNEDAAVYYVYSYAEGKLVEVLRYEVPDPEHVGQFMSLCDWNHTCFVIAGGEIDALEDIDSRCHFCYYSLQDGAFVCTKLSSEEETLISGKTVYSSCMIDGEAVSPEAYEVAVNSYSSGCRLFCMPLGESEIRSIASGLGMTQNEINQLLKVSR